MDIVDIEQDFQKKVCDEIRLLPEGLSHYTERVRSLSAKVAKVEPGSYLRARGVAPRKPGAPLAEEVIRRLRDT